MPELEESKKVLLYSISQKHITDKNASGSIRAVKISSPLNLSINFAQLYANIILKAAKFIFDVRNYFKMSLKSINNRHYNTKRNQMHFGNMPKNNYRDMNQPTWMNR